ncbi:MAG: MOSC domain-containing protein [Gammaproteobacteria bacterium]|nr:MOSC domain-containing protein [Gammaproteobacteria bacterium]MBQ0839224.1 MOSC domain-containing protein [Gammaproteobacteria bacterium]
MATLKGIAYRLKSKGEMHITSAVDVTPERGVKDDYRGKPHARQVTVLSVEDWQRACAELGADLHWTTRRANLLVEGISFSPASVGDIIQIGGLRMQITRETDPCPRMEDARAGLMKALTPDWRGGACCRVLSAGDIAIGDTVEVIAAI